MIYGIIGPRDFEGGKYTNYSHVESVLGSFSDMEKLVSGGSKGVEQMAERWAKETDIEFDVVRPNLKMHGAHTAFPIRNSLIIDQTDTIIVFWDGTRQDMVSVLSHCMNVRKEVALIPMK